MKKIRFGTKIAVGFCGILLIISTLAASPAFAKSAPKPTLQDVLDAIVALQNSVNNLESFQGNMPPAWYKILPSDQRFLLVMGDKAVLDRETGLVWEKSPGNVNGDGVADTDDTLNWYSAQRHCNDLKVENRKGWRLPTVQELMSLVDPTQSSPALPTGHPFQNVQVSLYWSATTCAYVNLEGLYMSDAAWFVNFYDGSLTNGVKSPNFFFVWCVRGGQGVDPQ